MSEETIDTRGAAERYMRAGLAVIPVPAGAKNPNRPGWQTEQWTIEDIPRCWSNGQNIGVLTGEPSGWLVDVDLDCPEAVMIAGRFLDPTLTSGRESTPDAHWWYRSEGIRSVSFEGLDGETILEIRSNGRQTVVAPSLHPSGERYRWSESGLQFETRSAKALLRACRELATAALIARVLPSRGRHRFGLALAGFLLRRGLESEATEKIMHAAWDAAGFSSERAKREAHDDIAAIVEDTAEGLEDGAEISGGPTLDELKPGLPRKIARIWRWNGRGPEPPANERTEREEPSAGFNLTDLGNAGRLIARHGNDLRYVHPWGKWLAWDGRRWAPDATGEVERRAVETVASIYTEAARAEDKDERKAIARHAERSESRSRIEAMIVLARSRPGIPVMPEDLDTDLWALNTTSGTLDLRTGKLREHRREDLITKLVPGEYDPDAQAPRFAQFLREIFDGDEDLIAFVQRFAGYSLTGSTEERVFAILHGSGKNGKTTLVELLQDLMGDYARNTDTETVLRKRTSGISNDVAALKGARFVSAAEIEQGRALAESKVKNLTGSDTVTARFLFAEPFDFRPEFKLWLSTNNKPVIHGTDDAIWDRIRLIPFTRRFAGSQADHTLPRKLRTELPGVLAWMIAGCLEWQRDGLGDPEQVRDATKGYRVEMDTLAAFFEDRCVIHPKAEVPATLLYKVYEEWCAENGEPDESQRRFGGHLQERGFASFKYTAGPHKDRKGWRGIGLRDDGHHDDDSGGDGGGGDAGGQTNEQSSTADDQTRASANKRELDTHKAAQSGDDRPRSGQTADNRPQHESVIGMGEPTEDGEGADKRGRKISNLPTNPPREGRIRKKGPQGPQSAAGEASANGNQPHVDRYGNLTRHDDRYPSVEALLADPPEWLTSQLGTYRQDPEKHIGPLCTAVAAVVLGDGMRGDEVRDEVEREVGRR